MTEFTSQMREWSEEFGRDYTDRNPQSVASMNELYRQNFGHTRTELNERFLGQLDRTFKVLEVGCNVGTQLLCLQEMGFANLYGIEIQRYALDIAKMAGRLNLVNGSALEMPFKNGAFDIVFTSGVLIHIHPQDVAGVLDEIYRCSGNYIWGYEYYHETYTAVRYRGKENLLWKANFAQIYAQRFPDLVIINKELVKYRKSGNFDSMFLLQKIAKK